LLRRAAEFDRRFLGLGAAFPASLRRRIRRRLGIRPRPSPRRYIPPSLGVEGFLRALRERNVRYAVLRWFEALPRVGAGEDIDILVADADLPVLASLLDDEDGLVPCDIYTETSLPGTAYRGTSYLPPSRAADLLGRARLQAGLVRVPAPDDHFLSLAYHAVYQKGLASGLPTASPGLVPTTAPEHDYTAILADLARTLSLDVRITMEDLDALLAERGWRPPADMISILSQHNPWLMTQKRIV
jgi:hypothetical protein